MGAPGSCKIQVPTESENSWDVKIFLFNFGLYAGSNFNGPALAECDCRQPAYINQNDLLILLNGILIFSAANPGLRVILAAGRFRPNV
jgi:hypothetical protein